MARTKIAKILQDTDGVSYTFDSIAFSDVILSLKDTKTHRTIQKIMEEIAEACSVSIEAVKHWKAGHNGVGDIETAKCAASVLKVDYHEFLSPVVETQEVQNMSIKKDERTVIEEIFEECVAQVYRLEKEVGDFEIQWPKLTPEERERGLEALALCNKEEMRKIHMLVDKRAIRLRQTMKYSLHRILIDFECLSNALVNSDVDVIPEAWSGIGDTICGSEEIFLNFRDRKDFLTRRGGLEPALYLIDEIELASELGFNCIEPKNEEEWLEVEQMNDCTNFGFVAKDEGDFELSPNIVGINLFVNILKAVFDYYFPMSDE